MIFDVSPAVDNSDKTTRVVYCDAFTGDVVDEGIVTYAYHTIFNIDNLDCPEGYEHYQYELKSRNDAITKLLYIDGKWYPADSEIVLLIEKLPVIKVKIVDENRNTVYEYNEYAPYGEHEAEADIPEGYTAVSDENFTVSVTRDENGRLISNISEFVVTVKNDSEKPEEPDKPEKPEEPAKPEEPDKPEEPEQPVKPEEPAKPEKPAKPEEPAKPEQPVEPDKPTNPNTSGDIPFAAAAAPVVAVAVMISTVTARKRKK